MVGVRALDGNCSKYTTCNANFIMRMWQGVDCSLQARCCEMFEKCQFLKVTDRKKY